MKVLRLTLSLAVCVPGCALLGVMAAADRRFSAWGGAVVGGLLGAFFGLAFGGALPRGVADYCFGAGGAGGGKVKETSTRPRTRRPLLDVLPERNLPVSPTAWDG